MLMGQNKIMGILFYSLFGESIPCFGNINSTSILVFPTKQMSDICFKKPHQTTLIND